VNLKASTALRLDSAAWGYRVGETVGRNSTPHSNRQGQSRAPANHRVECSRCRDARGLPRAFAPERVSMVLVPSAGPDVVAIVCDDCRRPGEQVLELGHKRERRIQGKKED